MSRFDAYAASIPAKPEAIISALTYAFPDASQTMRRGKNGYTDLINFHTGGDQHATLMFGGNKDAWPHAFAMGERAPDFAEFVRDNYPVHRVTRADVADDFDDPTAFDRLTRAGLDLADRRDIKVKHTGDYHREKDGRTMYFGSRKTGSLIRVYEKGKQLPLAGRPYWVRCELEAHPQGVQRLAMATQPPEAFYGLRAWTKEAAEDLLELSISRLLDLPPTPTDDERSLRWMLKQYGPMLKRTMAAMGPVEFFAMFQDELA